MGDDLYFCLIARLYERIPKLPGTLQAVQDVKFIRSACPFNSDKAIGIISARIASPRRSPSPVVNIVIAETRSLMRPHLELDICPRITGIRNTQAESVIPSSIG